LKRKGIFASLWREADRRRRLEGYTLSVVFHVILLLSLATITISAGGSGFGFGLRPKGARVELQMRDDKVADSDLEDLIQDVDVKPLDVQHTRVNAAKLPELQSFSAPRPRPERLARVDTRYSPTSGSVGTLSGQFGTTASMQFVIDDIKARAVGLVSRIQSLVPVARVGVVAFRDRGEDFVVRWSDLSFHASKIEAFVNSLTAEGGGDWEEGVRQGLEAAIDDLSWRKRAKRVIIIVGSSPPHKEDMDAIRALCQEFHDAGGVISTIDVTKVMHERYETKLHEWLYGSPPKKISPLPPFYQQVRDSYATIAREGGGEMAALGSDEQLAEKILYFAFGSRWKSEVARYSTSE
jgi:hypothetical protein